MTALIGTLAAIVGVVVVGAPAILLRRLDVEKIPCLAESLYIETAGGTASPFFRKGYPVPCSHTQKFQTTHDDQEVIDIHLLHGFSDRVAMNSTIGNYRITGIPPGLAGRVELRVTFKVDRGGSVSVTAKLKRSALEVECLTIQPERMAIAKMAPPDED